MSHTKRLKVISINIEGSKHLNRVLDFIAKEKPDVLCLQEVMQKDLTVFSDFFGTEATFVPMTTHEAGVEGIAMISIYPKETYSVQYAGNQATSVPTFSNETYEEMHSSRKFQLLVAKLKVAETDFTIATTHATVTEKAKITDYQINSIKSLITELDKLDEFVLFGDLNAPRGLLPFTMLAKKYQDNIPTHYTSSIDPVLHRNAPLERMVDGCFSTEPYLIENVRLESGVSDHCAIYAEVTK